MKLTSKETRSTTRKRIKITNILISILVVVIIKKIVDYRKLGIQLYNKHLYHSVL